MHKVLRLSIVSLLLVCTMTACQTSARNQSAQKPTAGAAATVHPIASEAAAAALKRGGNAVDAAVAAALMLGVVDGHNSGIGGGCFMLLRRADGTIVALDGREMAPAAATRDMFIRDGRADTKLSQTGALASGVPGSLAVYDEAISKYGRLKLPDLLRSAADVAERGFVVNDAYAARYRRAAKALAAFPSSRGALLKEDGSPYASGETLRQVDLAATYRAIADNGIGWFYGGPFAEALQRWMRENGGLLTAADFAGYRMVRREPLVTRYRQYTIVGFPPPSSGGVHVAQILNMLDSFDLRELEQRDPALRIHVMAEAMKLAFADRAHWLGDPDFVPVPRGLVDRAYAQSLAKQISIERTAAVPGHGTPPRADEDVFGKHTTHIAAADAEGNWVALTATINTGFGSKVIVPGTGVLLNNQMDDFSIQPGVPNAFGLIGNEANAVAPRKRPLSSMSPTIVLKDNKPILTLGAAGGPRIITQVVQTIVNHLDLGDPLPAALKRPRFHHQWVPKQLWVERTLPEAIRARLEKLGHALDVSAPAGATQAISRSLDGQFIPQHDPRTAGKAIVVTPN